ncbi:MAG TPA: hypothetical protein VIH93_07165 [Thermoanaerobaculia bacterium]
MRIDILFPLLFALSGAGFLALGLRGLFERRPLVFRSRLLLVLLGPVLLAGPVMISARIAERRLYPVPPYLLLTLGTSALICAALAIVLRGYVVCGTDDRSLVATLQRVLAGLGLYSEKAAGGLRVYSPERGIVLRLPAMNADLMVQMQPGTGGATLRMSPENRIAFDRIAAALRDALVAEHGPFRRLSFILWTGVGIALLTIGIMAFLP